MTCPSVQSLNDLSRSASKVVLRVTAIIDYLRALIFWMTVVTDTSISTLALVLITIALSMARAVMSGVMDASVILERDHHQMNQCVDHLIARDVLHANPSGLVIDLVAHVLLNSSMVVMGLFEASSCLISLVVLVVGSQCGLTGHPAPSRHQGLTCQTARSDFQTNVDLPASLNRLLEMNSPEAPAMTADLI